MSLLLISALAGPVLLLLGMATMAVYGMDGTYNLGAGLGEIVAPALLWFGLLGCWWTVAVFAFGTTF